MLIDPAIRDWVLLPLLALVVILHFVRLYAMRLATSDPTPDVAELKQKGVVARSQRLRANGGYITGQGFTMRKDHFLKADSGQGQLNDPAIADKPPNLMAQPDMMKQQLLGMVRAQLDMSACYTENNAAQPTPLRETRVTSTAGCKVILHALAERGASRE